jgi:hypothetical protein
VSVFFVFVQSHNKIGDKIALSAFVLLQFVVFAVEKFQPRIVTFHVINHKVIRFCSIRTNGALVNTPDLAFLLNFFTIFLSLSIIVFFRVLLQFTQIEIGAFTLRFESQRQF